MHDKNDLFARVSNFLIPPSYFSLQPTQARGVYPAMRFPTSYFLLPTFRAILALTLFSSPAFAKAPKAPGAIVKWKDIPAAVQATIQTSAAGGKVENVQKIAINGVFIYCAEVKAADGKWTKVYTTDAGALMKTEPDNARNKRKHKPLFG
ncbi:MAG: hypothetical protein QOF24_629 [Verrucomicrobiota bacterium]|jgi:hypothetical protein